MYCEYLIPEIKGAKTDGERQEKTNEFFLANYGMVLKFVSVFKVPAYERDDFCQLCFFAMLDALRAFGEGKNTFLSYYRRCVMHQYFVYRLTMRYPFRVNRQVYSALSEGDSTYPSVLSDGAYSYYEMDGVFNAVEQEMLSGTVWEIVRQSTTGQQYAILYMHYRQGRTYRDIAAALGYTESQVKWKKKDAFCKLRRKRVLREIARDVYGIVVRESYG